ncbi:hypothetical protein CP10139811_0225A, partial [Chlamydia ibidis]
MAYVNLLLL